MIIIAENKKNHYLIKKFLIETGIENDSSKRHIGIKPVSNIPPGDNPEQYVQLGLKPVESENIHTDTEEIMPDDVKFIELVNKDQKYKKLSRLAAKGLLTFVMIAKLFNAVPDQKHAIDTNQPQTSAQKAAEDEVEKEMIAKSPNSAGEIEATFDNIQKENTEDVFIDYDKIASFNEIVDIIIGHEDFRSTPYPDHKQWSIGYGSRVSDKSGSFINKSQHSKLRPTYNRLYKRYQRSGSNTDLKRLLRWTNKNYSGNWYKDLHGSKDNTKRIEASPLTIAQGKVMLVDSLKNELQRLQSNANFKLDEMPENVQIALSDMAYNMGGGFIIKFKKLHDCLILIDKIQRKNNITKLDKDVLADLFMDASQEIQNSLYYEELPNRAKSNILLVKNAIENFKISNRKSNGKSNGKSNNESLKKAYSNLFV